MHRFGGQKDLGVSLILSKNCPVAGPLTLNLPNDFAE